VEAVWAVDKLQDSAILHWRSVVMTSQPGIPNSISSAKKHQTASEQTELRFDVHRISFGFPSASVLDLPPVYGCILPRPVGFDHSERLKIGLIQMNS
jgi:hypothetical protein